MRHSILLLCLHFLSLVVAQDATLEPNIELVSPADNDKIIVDSLILPLHESIEAKNSIQDIDVFPIQNSRVELDKNNVEDILAEQEFEASMQGIGALGGAIGGILRGGSLALGSGIRGLGSGLRGLGSVGSLIGGGRRALSSGLRSLGGARALGSGLRGLAGGGRALGSGLRSLSGGGRALGSGLRSLSGGGRALGSGLRSLSGGGRALGGGLRNLGGGGRALGSGLRNLGGRSSRTLGNSLRGSSGGGGRLFGGAGRSSGGGIANLVGGARGGGGRSPAKGVTNFLGGGKGVRSPGTANGNLFGGRKGGNSGPKSPAALFGNRGQPGRGGVPKRGSSNGGFSNLGQTIKGFPNQGGSGSRPKLSSPKNGGGIFGSRGPLGGRGGSRSGSSFGGSGEAGKSRGGRGFGSGQPHKGFGVHGDRAGRADFKGGSGSAGAGYSGPPRQRVEGLKGFPGRGDNWGDGGPPPFRGGPGWKGGLDGGYKDMPGDFIGSDLRKGVDKASDMGKEITKQAGDAAKQTNDIAKQAGDIAKEISGSFLDTGKEIAKEAGDIAEEVGGTFLDTGTEIAKEAGDIAKEAGGTFLDTASELAQEASSTFLDTASELAKEAGGIVLDASGDIAKEASSAIAEAIAEELAKKESPEVLGGAWGTDYCACLPVECPLRGLEACLCQRKAALDCLQFQGANCPPPFVVDCDAQFGNVPPPLDEAPVDQQYTYTQTYRNYSSWNGAGTPPADFQFQDTPVVITTKAALWWTPYGNDNPYKYEGWPAAPTQTPIPPPLPPPIGVPIDVVAPAVFKTNVLVTYDGGQKFYSSGYATVVVTTRTTLTPDNSPYQRWASIQSFKQPSAPLYETPLTGPEISAVPKGYDAQPGSDAFGLTRFPAYGGYCPDMQPMQTQLPVDPNMQSLPQRYDEYEVIPGTESEDTMEAETLQQISDSNQQPSASLIQKLQQPQTNNSSSMPPSRSYLSPNINQSDNTPQKSDKKTIYITVEKHTVIIPAETITVTRGQTVTISGSTAIVTGPYPHPDAGGYAATPALWTGVVRISIALARNATSKPISGTAATPVPVRKGWTPVNPRAPFTPGFEPVAAQTAFFEPPRGSNDPGVPVFETPVKCGPDSPRCGDNLYCDPQPLCNTGAKCPGVCLPIYGGKFSQPENIRNQIWDKIMNEGVFKVR